MSLPLPVTLANGRQISMIGFGTYKVSQAEMSTALSAAIEVGYRHIDCAAFYGNEKFIGDTLNEVYSRGAVKREDLFLTSKIWNTAMRPENTRRMALDSMRKLGTDYLDLLLIHWPVSIAPAEGDALSCASETGVHGKVIFENVDWADTWKELEKMHKEGLLRSIGVSNFTTEQMTRLWDMAEVKPAVLQVECHPLLIQPKLRAFCKEKNIQMTAYCPLGNPGRVEYVNYANEPVIVDIAKKHNKSWSDIILKWHIQMGNVVIPKSSNPGRIKANYDACTTTTFTLNEDEVAAITAMGSGRLARIVNPGSWTPDGTPFFKNCD